jgi:MFS family permease
MKNKLMTFSEFKGYVVSSALASAVLFGYGHHPTVDALIVTAVWIFLVFVIVAVATMIIFTIAIRRHEKRNDKELGKFYKGIAELHKHPAKRLFGLLFVGYWLYALIVQEWTVTAVIYLITVAVMQAFIFMTKDIAKDFFVNQLKGEGINE